MNSRCGALHKKKKNLLVRIGFLVGAVKTHFFRTPSCSRLFPHSCCGYKNASTKCPLPPKNLPTDVLRGCCGICSQGDGDDTTPTDSPTRTGWRPPINSCNFDMTGSILKWILGDENVTERGVPSEANLFAVNQQQFLSGNWTVKGALLDTTGEIRPFEHFPMAPLVASFLHVHRTAPRVTRTSNR